MQQALIEVAVEEGTTICMSEVATGQIWEFAGFHRDYMSGYFDFTGTHRENENDYLGGSHDPARVRVLDLISKDGAWEDDKWRGIPHHVFFEGHKNNSLRVFCEIVSAPDNWRPVGDTSVIDVREFIACFFRVT